MINYSLKIDVKNDFLNFNCTNPLTYIAITLVLLGQRGYFKNVGDIGS